MGIRSTSEIFGPTLDDLPFSENDAEKPAPEQQGTETQGSASETPAETAPAEETEETETVKAGDAAPDAEDVDDDPKDLEGLKSTLRKVRRERKEERKLRKEREREVLEMRERMANIEGRLSTMSQPQSSGQTEKSAQDRLDEFIENPPNWTQKQIASAVSQLREEARTEQIKVQESFMRRSHEDYDDVYREFEKVANQERWRWQAVFNEPDPAWALYQQGKQILAQKNATADRDDGDADDPHDSEIAELKARLAALENKPAPTQQASAPRKPIPKQTYADARGSGIGKPPTWGGPRSTEDVFKGGFGG